MNIPILTLGIALCLLAPRLGAQDAPKKPGPEHKKLEMMTGTWKYDETDFESPFGRAGKATFTSASHMIMGGFFLEERGKGVGPDGPYTWLVVTACDPEKGNYYSYNFDSAGAFGRPGKGEIGTGTLQGNTWTWTWNSEAKGKSYPSRSVAVYSPDGKTMTYQWSYSEDGTNWKPWLSGKATRVGKARAK